jgi:nickel-dependent lactate racemase
VLVLIPDGTRHAPIPLLYRELGQRVARLDYLVALGTHPPMSEVAIAKLVGASAAERAEGYPKRGSSITPGIGRTR